VNRVKVIPLGGVREFGLNSMVVRTSAGAVLIDAGLMFPKFNSTGIEQLIPDFSYVVENQEAFQGIVLTHGHEDHIGALPYLLREAPIPVYGHPFALELARRKLRECDADVRARLVPVYPGDRVELGGMEIAFTEVEHSTIGCYSLCMRTPQGIVVHSGDFKTLPPTGFCPWGAPVELFVCDSTNAEIDPRNADEKVVCSCIEDIVKNTEGAVVVSTFSSNVMRIRMLYEIAVTHNRKVTIIGRSLTQVVDIATDLGLLELESRDLVKPEEITTMDRSRLMVICTGTQGEMYSVLSLIARGWHRFKVRSGDSVIISARIIPGNEIAIGRCIDQLIDYGARVYYPDVAPVHATGHATHHQLVEAVKSLSPRIVMPVHGELRHMKALAELVSGSPGARPEFVFARAGQEWSLADGRMELTGEVPHGKCFVDGELTGDIKDVVLRDRRHISEGGLIVVFTVLDSANAEIVLGPDIMCKGVVPASMEAEIVEEIKQVAASALEASLTRDTDTQVAKNRVRESIGSMIKARLGKKPMIIPVIMEL